MASALSGEIAGVVTGPVHKARMQDVGFHFPGQTEFFAQRAQCENFAMCLTGGALTVALVTVHVPLRTVADSLTAAEIVRVGLLLAEFLRQRHGRVPRLAVAGFNPHAGEAGAFGREENPDDPNLRSLCCGANLAISRNVPGPLSPDTVFHRAAGGEIRWSALHTTIRV